VALQFSFLIDGELITRVSSGDFVFLCKQLLGFVSPATIKGNSINFFWLNNSFQTQSNEVTNNVIGPHARANILTPIRSLLMPDISYSRVH